MGEELPYMTNGLMAGTWGRALGPEQLTLVLSPISRMPWSKSYTSGLASACQLEVCMRNKLQAL